MSSTRSPSPRGPVIRPLGAPWADAALVLCAHGARGRSPSAAAHARAIRALSLFAEVHACCLRGEPGLPATLDRVHARRAFLVPMMMADGHTTRGLLAHQLASRRRAKGEPEIVSCQPVGLNPGLAGMIAERAAEVRRAADWAPADVSLLLVAHGTARDPGSRRAAEAHADRIRKMGKFAAVATAFLEEDPTVPVALAALPTRDCVAVGLFTEHGCHGEEDLPRLLARGGRNTIYTGPIGANARLIELVVQQVAAADAIRGAA